MTRRAVAAMQSSSAPLVAIPRRLRLEWIDLMASDPNVPNSAFRVGCVIGSHLNRFSGSTFLKQETIAKAFSGSESTVWRGVTALEGLGYLIVKRRELGTITRATKNGPLEITLAGGKGVANTYHLAIPQTLSETRRGAALILKTKELDEPIVVNGDDHDLRPRSPSLNATVVKGDGPTLSSPLGKNPLPNKTDLKRAETRLVEGAIAMEWVTEDDPLWPQIVAAFARLTGRRPVVGGSRWFSGIGYAFPAHSVQQVRAASRPMQATG